jgi:MFS family permease
MGAVLFGWHVGFSSPTDTDVRIAAKLTTDQVNLMFSLLAVGAMPGALMAGRVADAVGRKTATMFGAAPYTLGALLMALWVTYPGLVIGVCARPLSISPLSPPRSPAHSRARAQGAS